MLHLLLLPLAVLSSKPRVLLLLLLVNALLLARGLPVLPVLPML